MIYLILLYVAAAAFVGGVLGAWCGHFWRPTVLKGKRLMLQRSRK